MIKDQKLLYHLTALENLESILKHGLISRSQAYEKGFKDIADEEIIDSRKNYSLDEFVPFHFFTKNPFDGSVQKNYPDIEFVLITVQRAFAEKQGWSIIPLHPLSNEKFELLSYKDGVQAVNWELMEQRDYSNRECKQACMAECLSPKPVLARDFHSVFVKNDETKRTVNQIKEDFKADFYVNVNSAMFVSG